MRIKVKVLLAVIFVLIVGFTWGYVTYGPMKETTQVQKSVVEMKNTGIGYQISDENVELIAMKNEKDEEVSKFYFSDKTLGVDMYVEATEDKTLVGDKESSATLETVNFENPVKIIAEELQNIQFKRYSSNSDYVVYSGEIVKEYETPMQIEYTVYYITMDWKGESVSFRYYEYSDGETLISYEAPDDMKEYSIDMKTQTINGVHFDVIGTDEGKAISPSPTTTQTTETTTVYVYFNDNKIVGISYNTYNENPRIKILYDGIEMPIELGNQEMDKTEAESVVELAKMLWVAF